MRSIELKYSKSKIDKAGASLKQENLTGDQIDEALNILSNWRAYHASPLNTFAITLKSRVKKISNGDTSIVAQRLKRSSSIVLKLRLKSTMRLSTMQDIGGVRAVVKNVSEVYELVDLYRISKTKHILLPIDDYIRKPKSDGYRSVHLVYQVLKEPSLYIEIQIRSQLQHIWATAVEVFGTLKSSSFKSGQGDKRWLELFAYLSSAFSLKEGTPVLEDHQNLTRSQILLRLKKLIRDLKAVDQLNVYTTIYKISSNEVREKGRSGNYSLILLDSQSNTISVQTFSAEHIREATSVYTEMEKKYFSDPKMNLVLVNTGDIKRLEASYPNYFMDTKKLIQYLSLIMLDEF